MKIATLKSLLFPSHSIPQVSLGVIRRCLPLADRLRRDLPDPAPLTGREASVNGYLFAEGPAIVDRVVRALRGSGRLFSGYPDPAPMEFSNLRALGLRNLSRAFRQLAERTEALGRLEQAGATKEALAILQEARQAARGPRATREDRARAEALIMAEELVLARRRRTAGAGGK